MLIHSFLKWNECLNLKIWKYLVANLTDMSIFHLTHLKLWLAVAVVLWQMRGPPQHNLSSRKAVVLWWVLQPCIYTL